MLTCTTSFLPSMFLGILLKIPVVIFWTFTFLNVRSIILSNFKNVGGHNDMNTTENMTTGVFICFSYTSISPHKIYRTKSLPTCYSSNVRASPP